MNNPIKQNMSTVPLLSILIPIKDETANISILAEEIEKTMAGQTYSWECVWIDDGSTDTSLSELQTLHKRKPAHHWIALSRNFGQSAALYTGFRLARGTYIATLDGDGQNDPGDIPALLSRLMNDDLDMINGVRRKRNDSLIRKISSRIGNGFRNLITKENITDVGCSLRVFKHCCVENVPLFKGMHRFLPTLARISGHSKIIELPVHHRPRQYGTTKYGIQNRLWVGLADTMAVRWMQGRMVFPQVKNTSLTQPEKGN